MHKKEILQPQMCIYQNKKMIKLNYGYIINERLSEEM